MKYKKNFLLIILCILLILILVSLLSLLLGSRITSIGDLLRAIMDGEGTSEYSILFNIRLPRILIGFAVGGGLSLAGAIVQGIFRNPLVEPYTLGISGGATLGVCFNLLSGVSGSFGLLTRPVFGFLGAFAVILILYTLSMKKGVIKMNGLLLTGVMISYISSSTLMLIMSLSKAETVHGIIFWIMGSLEETSWLLIGISIIVSLCGLAVSYFFCINLNALSIGEDGAAHLGINVERTKRIYFIIASLLTGFAVSISGVIAFVGLIVPHFLRMFIGGDNRILLVSSFLAGAAFLIFCDTVARTVLSPVELPVGVITGIIGGCFFIYTLTRRGLLWEK
jgi:iron complex transport system permease protein